MRRAIDPAGNRKGMRAGFCFLFLFLFGGKKQGRECGQEAKAASSDPPAALRPGAAFGAGSSLAAPPISPSSEAGAERSDRRNFDAIAWMLAADPRQWRMLESNFAPGPAPLDFSPRRPAPSDASAPSAALRPSHAQAHAHRQRSPQPPRRSAPFRAFGPMRRKTAARLGRRLGSIGARRDGLTPRAEKGARVRPRRRLA